MVKIVFDNHVIYLSESDILFLKNAIDYYDPDSCRLSERLRLAFNHSKKRLRFSFFKYVDFFK